MSSTKMGLKLVASLEASKGLLTILVVFALHKYGGQDLQHGVEVLISHLHLNPANYFLQEITQGLGNLTQEKNFTLILAGTSAYVTIRFIEAYGLWHAYRWTEWFSLLSGGLYIPFELYELFTNPNLLTVIVLLINLMVVCYMYRIVNTEQ